MLASGPPTIWRNLIKRPDSRSYLYLEEAKYWGYGYYADRMKKDMLPLIQSEIELLEQKLEEFENRYPFFLSLILFPERLDGRKQPTPPA